jgi:hypothetical protein
LGCDALAYKPTVEVTASGLRGMDVSDFDFDSELSESLLASPKAFLDFVKAHWDRVLHAVFVFQIQPLDPEFWPFLVFVQPAAHGKAREQRAQLLQELKVVCGRECITIDIFETDDDSGYDEVHEMQACWNLELFITNPVEMASKRHYPVLSDLLHIMKRARYRMLKEQPMVVGLETSSPELSLRRLVRLLGDVLLAVVFSDGPITKMHDSLPMVLFRFEILVKLYEVREMVWFAYFFPWVLINEGMWDKQVDTYGGVRWFQIAHLPHEVHGEL